MPDINELVREALKASMKDVIRETFSEEEIKETVTRIAEKEMTAKDYMTILECQRYMNVSFNTVKAWQNKGLKTITLDGKRFISRDTLKQFLKDFEA